MTGRDIDSLLEAYLGSDGSTAKRPPDVEASPPSAATAVADAPTQAEPRGPAAKPDLQELLARYLATFPSDEDDSGREFTLPRSAEIDELLRRHVVDNEDVKQELLGSLRDHLETEPHDDRAPAGSPQWAQVAVSTQHESLTLDERVERYAQAYAEHDDQAHVFTADSSTIKGVPPPNSPPIPARSPVAKERASQTPPPGPKKDR